MWTTATLDVSLIRPDGVMITPPYASSHADEVSYTAQLGDDESLPSVVYYVTTTVPGPWQLVIRSHNLAPEGIRYITQVFFDTNRTLTLARDVANYQEGDTAIFTATLTVAGVGVSNAAVDAVVARTDGVTETLRYHEVTPGIYVATYTVPSAAGFVAMEVTAAGSDAGGSFIRYASDLWSIAPGGAAIGEEVTEKPVDLNSDGAFDKLLIGVPIEVSRPASYALSAQLTRDGVLIASTAVYSEIVATGVYTLQLEFSGDDIRAAGLNGPFVVSNAMIIDVDFGSAPVDAVEILHITAAYTNSLEKFSRNSGAGRCE